MEWTQFLIVNQKTENVIKYMKINNIEESVPFKKKISSEAVARRSAEACKFIKKETLVQVFSCEFCEISNNTFCYRTPPVAASVSY